MCQWCLMAPKYLHLLLRISLFFSPSLSLSLWLDWLSRTQPSAACEPVREDRLPHIHTHTLRLNHAQVHTLIHLFTHTLDLIHTHPFEVSSRCLTHHWIWKDVHGVCPFVWVFVYFWEYYEVTVYTSVSLWKHLEKQTPPCCSSFCLFL